MILTGNQAPTFTLPDLRGNLHSLMDLHGRIAVLTFWSAECEWCERVDRELVTYLDDWKGQVDVWWIASNLHEPREMIDRVARERNLPIVLLDQHQEVADQYGAQTTPHFFVVNKDGNLAYQGAWDDITFRQREATQVYIPMVVEALINNQAPQITSTPPYGCVLVRSFEG